VSNDLVVVVRIVDGKACEGIGVASGTRTHVAAHADRIDTTRRDTTRRSRGCIVRIAIQSQPRRFDMTSINACASRRFTACMTPSLPSRGIVRSCVAR